MMQKISRLYIPALVTPKNAVVKSKEAVSKSQRLMNDLGLVKPATNGTFQIMPLAQRSLDKLCLLINEAMSIVEGQKISLPILTSSSLWKKSGRLEGDITEFFMLRDRHEKEYLLSPTHEEVVTAMLASTAPISYKQLPLRLYQIGPKFRDELKARFGLMRAKEFLMKDMYTFDSTEKEAIESYAMVNEAYTRLFTKLEVPFEKVEASTGMMGGKMSHEYHYISQTGEDHLLHCQDCNYSFNIEVADNKEVEHCAKCKSHNIKQVKGMEIAHAFLLGDRYSKAFNATYLHKDGKPRTLLMGCYGIGISRVLAAAIEILSTENEIKWPTLIAPFDICIIGPKQGSQEQQKCDIIEEELCNKVCYISGKENVIHDDRKYLTIGKRLLEAKRIGFPVIIVVGSKASTENPLVEVIINNQNMLLDVASCLKEISKYHELKSKLRNS